MGWNSWRTGFSCYAARMSSPWPHHRVSNGTALVVGGNGFIAGFIVARLRQNGWTVLKGVRQPSAQQPDEIQCDLRELLTPEQWEPLLEGVDAVVNAAGILREEGGQTFDMIHYQAPLALAQACVKKGISRFVQISALGHPDDGEFVASKHKLDHALQQMMDLDAVILRPSVVYSTAGSYGGTSLLRALAGFPYCNLLPGDAHWKIQPVCAEDLGMIAAEAVDRGRDGVYDIGCQDPMSLRAYQQQWRQWLRIPGTAELELPETLVDKHVATWEFVGKGGVGGVMWNMLRRGNTAPAHAWQRVSEAFGTAPRSVEEVLLAQPSQVQDRWQAQLYFLGPFLKFMIALAWIISGAAGILAASGAMPVLGQLGIYGQWGITLVGTMGVLDLILAALLAFYSKPRRVLVAMAVQTLLYTAILGAMVPALWLDTMGGLAKNLVLLPALAVMWVLAERR